MIDLRGSEIIIMKNINLPISFFKEIYMLTNFIRDSKIPHWCHSWPEPIGGNCSYEKHIKDIIREYDKFLEIYK